MRAKSHKTTALIPETLFEHSDEYGTEWEVRCQRTYHTSLWVFETEDNNEIVLFQEGEDHNDVIAMSHGQANDLLFALSKALGIPVKVT